MRQIGGCIEGCQRPSDTIQRDRESSRIFYVKPVSIRDPRSKYSAGDIAFAHCLSDHAVSVLNVMVSRISVPSASATSHSRARLADVYSVVS